MKDVEHSILDLFQRVKSIADRIPSDFGGGSPLSKIFLMAYTAHELNMRSYVEIGVYRGKSFFPMAYIAKLIGGKAYGIDAYDFETAKEYDVDQAIIGDVNGFLAELDFSQIYQDVKNLQEVLGLMDHSEIIRNDSKNAVQYFQEIKSKLTCCILMAITIRMRYRQTLMPICLLFAMGDLLL